MGSTIRYNAASTLYEVSVLFVRGFFFFSFHPRINYYNKRTANNTALFSSLHFGSDAYWECYIRAKTGPENHQAGTCKMGPATDADAVVDPQLRVHGVPNIRVADPSIFPYLPNANPIAAIMMVAEKASNMIINSW